MKLRPLVARSQGLAAAAVAALALGIGLTALMFAIVDGTVRRGLPVPDPGAVVHLERVPAPGQDALPGFPPAERETLTGQRSLAALAIYQLGQTTISGPGLTPRRWDHAAVTDNTFEILGARAALGSVLATGAGARAGGPVGLIVSDVVWREQFAAERSAVGRGVAFNGHPAVIQAVMPAGFRFPFNQHVWTRLDERDPAPAAALWGRLARGVTATEAEAELSARLQQAAQGQGSAAPRAGVTAFTSHILTRPLVRILDAMFLAGLGVLAIACANVANLLLARGLARQRDFAIASALGASSGRLMRERVVEGLVLAGAGAVLGVALTYAGANVFSRAIEASAPPYWVSVAVNGRVLLYVIAVTVLTALVAAGVPSWRSGAAAISTSLTDNSRASTSRTLRRTTAALVIVEVALSACVLVCAGLMGKGIARLSSEQYAFATADVSMGRVGLPAAGYPTPEARREFFITLHTRLQGLSGGGPAALASSVPFAAAATPRFSLDRRAPDPTRWPRARRVLISPGFFDTLGVRLIAGRDFEEADREGRAPVAIVNLSFALQFARREELIGRPLHVGTADAARPATIIGIVPDLHVGSVRGEQPEAIYLPLFQQEQPPGDISIVARGRAPASAVEKELRAALADLDPALPLDRANTLAAFRDSATWFYRVFGFLFLIFGCGALVLALLGVYAVMSFAVTGRRREIGTRMALGATRGNIAALFLKEGTLGLAVGLAAGGAMAAFFAPQLSLFLYQVEPRDASVFAAAAAAVAAVGLSACAVPALRAARQDPNASLRDE
ncbi:MAG: ABC transporter permease [Acidobacteriota bacterium]|nr:ABC transporter permease [Acidobacteriota bacterium]